MDKGQDWERRWAGGPRAVGWDWVLLTQLLITRAGGAQRCGGAAGTAAYREELSGAGLRDLAQTRLRGVWVMLTAARMGQCPLLGRSTAQGR